MLSRIAVGLLVSRIDLKENKMGFILPVMATVMERVYFVRKRAGSGLSNEEVKLIQMLIEREDARIMARRQGIHRTEKKRRTIPLAQVIDPLEQSKEKYRGDAKYIAAVERTIKELKRRYDGHIPVDEV